jgi:tetratricopeptide (TPR) repeat protein
MLAVPAGDFVDSARPLIAAHPYRAAVECLGVDRARDYPRYQALARQVNIVDAEGTGIPFFLDILGNVDPAKGQDLFREAALREDTTEYDLMLFMPRLGAGDRAQDCRYLADVSPHSPVARAGLIETSWPEVEAKARAWEDEGAPPVLVALGYRYVELKRWDDAERCLSRSLKLAPEKYPYELLAHTFRARGDWKRWQETLDQYLERVDDYGLDHAQVRVQIANHLMDENRFKDAEPYAAAAAETWAAFGMICAARCYEGLKDWANAELWTRRDSERYPDGSWAKWYLFCKRTGHGEVDAARDYTAQYIASFGPRAGGEFRLASGCFYLMNGRKAEALEMFRGVTEGEALPASVLFSAFTADALGDTKLRDQCLERLVTDPKCAAAKAMPIYRLYRSALQAGDPVALDLAVVDKELAALPEENRGNAVFHVGWFLCLHGSPEKAAAYLKRCIDMDKTYFWYQYAAQEALNDPARVLGKPSRARVSRSAPATTGLDRL